MDEPQRLVAALALTRSTSPDVMSRIDQAEALIERTSHARPPLLGSAVSGSSRSDVETLIATVASIAVDMVNEAKIDVADTLARWALAAAEGVHGRSCSDIHSATAEALDALGRVYQARGKLGKAETMYRRALHISEHTLGRDHYDTAIILNNLASVLKDQCNLGEAEVTHRRALKIWEQTCGSDHPNTAASLGNLASVLNAQGRFGEAEAMHRRSLQIREQTLGRDHPDTASSLNNLAEVLKAQGKLGEAEVMHRRGLQIDEHTLGRDHPKTAISLSNLAGVLLAQDKLDEAEPLLRRAHSIADQALGPRHPSTLQFLHNLAVLLFELGRLDDAEPLFRRALCVTEKHPDYGPSHPMAVAARESLVDIHRRRLNPDRDPPHADTAAARPARDSDVDALQDLLAGARISRQCALCGAEHGRDGVQLKGCGLCGIVR
jgi:tetratricopeptide (TPR) repeat protein